MSKPRETKRGRPSEALERFFFIRRGPLITASIIIFLAMLTLHIFQVQLSKRPILLGNENSHIKLLHSIVTRHTFTIISPVGTDVSYYRGKYYSNKPPGFPFLLAPPCYLYLKLSGNDDMSRTFLFAKVSNAVFSALTIVCIFLFLSTFKLSRASILFGLIAATFGTIFPAYSTLANSHPLSFFLCTFSILFFRLSQIQREKSYLWAVSLFAAVYAIIVDYSNGFFLLPLIIVIWIKALKEKKFIVAILVSAFAISPHFFYSYKAFSNPFVPAYFHYKPPTRMYIHWEGARETMRLRNIPHGLYGLLFSPARGIFLLSPVTILGVIGSWQALRARNWSLVLITLMAITGILITSAYSLWHGGPCIGYRHILIAAIILSMLSSFVYERCKRWTRAIANLLLIFSCFTGIMSFFIQLDYSLLSLTWKWQAQPADIHANFYTELLYPYIKKHCLDFVLRK